jgi:hypothetical protein
MDKARNASHKDINAIGRVGWDAHSGEGDDRTARRRYFRRLQQIDVHGVRE